MDATPTLTPRIVFVGKQWPVHVPESFERWDTGQAYVCDQITQHSELEASELPPGSLLVPLMETDALTVHSFLKKRPDLLCVAPDPNSIACFWTKRAFAEYCCRHAETLLPFVPRHIQTAEDAETLRLQDPKTRFIAKPATEAKALVHALLHPESAQWTHPELLWSDYVVQELVPGVKEYVTHIVANEGKIVFDLTYEYTFHSETHIKGPVREHTDFEKVPISEAERSVLQSFLTPCRFSGACNANFKRHPTTGRIVVFEINPRLGGSLMLQKTRADLYVFTQHLLASAEGIHSI
jgi:hypothetical protein